jgi:hypothetical protein
VEEEGKDSIVVSSAILNVHFERENHRQQSNIDRERHKRFCGNHPGIPKDLAMSGFRKCESFENSFQALTINCLNGKKDRKALNFTKEFLFVLTTSCDPQKVNQMIDVQQSTREMRISGD